MFGLTSRREPAARAPHLAVQLADWECNVTAIEISIVHPGTTEIAICARWRVEEFAGVLGSSFEAERRTLDAFTGGQAHQVALIARRDGAPAGTCPLVPSEIDPVHSVSP